MLFKGCLFVSSLHLYLCIYLFNLYTLHGTQNHNLKIKSHMVFELGQPGAPNARADLNTKQSTEIAKQAFIYNRL